MRRFSSTCLSTASLLEVTGASRRAPVAFRARRDRTCSTDLPPRIQSRRCFSALAVVSRSDVLWAGTGKAAPVKLCGAIRAKVAASVGTVTIGACGKASAATALRALARCTRAGEDPCLQFQAHWLEEVRAEGSLVLGDGPIVVQPESKVNHSLRFRVAPAGSYSTFRHLGWNEVPILFVADSTEVGNLARAVSNHQRKKGRCVIKTNANQIGDSRVSVLAKALASMHRYTKSQAPPWCIATHFNESLAIHVLADGEKLGG